MCKEKQLSTFPRQVLLLRKESNHPSSTWDHQLDIPTPPSFSLQFTSPREQLLSMQVKQWHQGPEGGCNKGGWKRCGIQGKAWQGSSTACCAEGPVPATPQQHLILPFLLISPFLKHFQEQVTLASLRTIFFICLELTGIWKPQRWKRLLLFAWTDRWSTRT